MSPAWRNDSSEHHTALSLRAHTEHADNGRLNNVLLAFPSPRGAMPQQAGDGRPVASRPEQIPSGSTLSRPESGPFRVSGHELSNLVADHIASPPRPLTDRPVATYPPSDPRTLKVMGGQSNGHQ
ncbi:hypothetical protein ElyMa_000945700 [Elysia marginata]|uniref:Uncharacterized protein n=1 Tax=Elysia marginata TaxID=1093978 RepID=A0AAV4HDF5_9GAST|nr:hypothetical protein ElyMa_000945700 [Elysia marginata]